MANVKVSKSMKRVLDVLQVLNDRIGYYAKRYMDSIVRNAGSGCDSDDRYHLVMSPTFEPRKALRALGSELTHLLLKDGYGADVKTIACFADYKFLTLDNYEEVLTSCSEQSIPLIEYLWLQLPVSSYVAGYMPPKGPPREYISEECRCTLGARAKEAVEGMSAVLVLISPNRQVLLDLLQYAE